MSEQKLSYMAELDAWSDTEVIGPLFEAFELGKAGAVADAQVQIRKAIRGKVLESYRNGQTAGSRRPEAQKGRVWTK